MTNHFQGQVEEIQVHYGDPQGYLEIALLRENVFFLVKTLFHSLLFSAELKPSDYYLEHVFYLDHGIFTNMSHVYCLDQ